jgi:hypothetical protein
VVGIEVEEVDDGDVGTGIGLNGSVLRGLDVLRWDMG